MPRADCRACDTPTSHERDDERAGDSVVQTVRVRSAPPVALEKGPESGFSHTSAACRPVSEKILRRTLDRSDGVAYKTPPSPGRAARSSAGRGSFPGSRRDSRVLVQVGPQNIAGRALRLAVRCRATLLERWPRG